MNKHVLSGLRCLTASLLIGGLCLPAHADNQMGYRLLSQPDAQDLPHNHGALGMDIEAAQRITDGGMTFDLIRVKQVRSGSPGEQAGFHPGDEIPAGGGPQQAQRIAVTVGMAGQTAQPAVQADQPNQPRPGLSTGTKVAIGVGAVALFGCYELGCFSRHHRAAAVPPGQPGQPGMQSNAPQN